MKRTAILSLCLVMIITCFTACKQDAKPTTPESKTDVSTPAIVDQQPKEEVQAEADVSEPAQEEVKEPAEQAEENHEETKPVSKVESKPVSKAETKPVSKAETKPASKAESKPTSKVESKPVTSQEQSGGSDAEEPDIPVPTFKSETDLKNWLKGEGVSFTTERDQILNHAKNGNTIVYARPKLFGNENYVFFEANTFSRQDTSTITYQFEPKAKTKNMSSVSVTVTLRESKSDRDFYENAKKDAEGKKEFFQCIRQGNIDYYWGYNPTVKICLINWEQFGVVHSAHINYAYEQFEQILPLLELEQVTVKLNDDAVIK